MKALVQRVTSASVVVNEQTIASIDSGLLVYLGVEKADEQLAAQRLSKRVLGYRLFTDDADKMNLDVTDVQGDILVVSQFTLAADTSKGRRASFSSAALPQQAEQLYLYFIEQLRQQLVSTNMRVVHGQFAADMKVHSVNDGPINFNLTV